MKEKLFSDFNLVGGTSLALQMGYRISIDDADLQLQPIMYKEFDWNLCKQKIISEVLKL